jgi:hypothetical protein
MAEKRADRREEARRGGMERTARILQKQARKAGTDDTYSKHLARVQRAERKRKD